jgi:hypothetical protein
MRVEPDERILWALLRRDHARAALQFAEGCDLSHPEARAAAAALAIELGKAYVALAQAIQHRENRRLDTCTA